MNLKQLLVSDFLDSLLLHQSYSYSVKISLYQFWTFYSVKVAESPVEKPRRGRARAPAAERAARKRNSNKESSRRYRQKIKSQQNDLLSSLDQLSKVGKRG